MKRARRNQGYGESPLSEYWDCNLMVQKYSDLKELLYESTRRWIRLLQKVYLADASKSKLLELVAVIYI